MVGWWVRGGGRGRDDEERKREIFRPWKSMRYVVIYTLQNKNPISPLSSLSSPFSFTQILKPRRPDPSDSCFDDVINPFSAFFFF